MHFMEALTPYFHILLEFLLGTQIIPVSPSIAVWCNEKVSLNVRGVSLLPNHLLIKTGLGMAKTVIVTGVSL